jgi:hypothetical protein
MKPSSIIVPCCLACLLALGCDILETVPPERIKIKNGMGGDQWSAFEVSAGGTRYVLKAGQSVLLPHGTTSIRFEYEGRGEIREYLVQCPRDLKEGIILKLIDVDSKRMAGGCRTVWAERRKK